MKTYCPLPFNRMKINPDGGYQSCCHQTKIYGNLIQEDLTLEEAFNKPLLREVQEYALRSELHPICDTPRCPLYTLKDNLEEWNLTEVEIRNQPIDVEVSLPSTHCNIGGTNPTPDTACAMCPRASTTYMSWEPEEDLSKRVVEKIKPYMDKMQVINIQGIAEPFWKGKVIEMLEEIDFENHKHHALFWTFTNGTVFGDKIQDEFISRVKYANLGFSIDAATPETYKKVRRLDYFGTIERNLRKYFEKVKDFKTDDKWYNSFTSYNINMWNVHEMEQMVRWSHDIGADRAEFTLTFIGAPEFPMGVENICNKDNWHIFWEGQKRAIEVAEELNYKVDFYVPFHGGFLQE